MNTFLCGLGTGMTEALLVVSVSETFKTQLIHDRLKTNPKFKGIFHGMGEIIKKDGILGCYKGVVPTMMKSGTN